LVWFCFDYKCSNTSLIGIIYVQFIAVGDDFIPDCDTVNEKEQICLLVGSAVESAVVYMQVLIT